MSLTKRLLGYGGSGSVDGKQVLITGGSLESAYTISYLNMIQTLPTNSKASQVKHADGTAAFNGTISFDVDSNAMDAFMVTSGLLQRYYSFPVVIDDGTNSFRMTNCMVTSLSLQGSVGGLVSASVSFISATARSTGSTGSFIRDSAVPVGYWYSGSADGDDLRDWNLSMTQDASLAYKNENSVDPAYIKVGIVGYVLSVTSYKALTAPATIAVATSAFTLTGNAVGSGFSFNGLTDLGSYSYTFEASSDTGKSDALVIS